MLLSTQSVSVPGAQTSTSTATGAVPITTSSTYQPSSLTLVSVAKRKRISTSWPT